MVFSALYRPFSVFQLRPNIRSFVRTPLSFTPISSANLTFRAFRSTDVQQREKKLVTTPIFYVNGRPHIGHLYSAVLADAYSRWLRMHPENEVVFSTGTDEHGQKVEEAAAKHGKPVAEYCDEISATFRSMFDTFNISYDRYVRTTSNAHKRAVEEMWRRLCENGAIYEGTYEGWYCVSDESFLTEKQTKLCEKSNKRVSIDSGNVCIWTSERNYMFRLSAFRDVLLQYYKSNTKAIVPEDRWREVVRWLEENELSDLSVSRPSSKQPWGIRVPGDSDHCIYVWVDALTNYLTALGFGEKSESPLSGWPAHLHLIGKDIQRFHTIYWPAFLAAAKIEGKNSKIGQKFEEKSSETEQKLAKFGNEGDFLPRCVGVHSHWTVDGVKMSKSIGNVVDPMQMLSEGVVTVDSLRYFLLREGALEKDGNLSAVQLEQRCISELADTLGNLFSRTFAPRLRLPTDFPHREIISRVANVLKGPYSAGGEASSSGGDTDLSDLTALRSVLSSLPKTAAESFEALDFVRGLSAILEAAREMNRCFDRYEPWKLRRVVDVGEVRKMLGDSSEESNAAAAHRQSLRLNDPAIRMAALQYVVKDGLRLLFLLLQPVVPETADTALSYMGVPETRRGIDGCSVGDLRALNAGESVFTAPEEKPPVLFPKKR